MTTLDEHYEYLAGSEKPVLIKFGAEWCGPCKAMEPILSSVSQEYADDLDVIEYNVDADQEIASAYGVASIPAWVMVEGGTSVGFMTGAMGRGSLVDFITPSIEEHRGQGATV
jgi:thioredoxin 1